MNHGEKIAAGKSQSFLDYVESIYDHSDSPYKEIPLTKGYSAVVDSKHYDWLIRLTRWHVDNQGYAVGNVKQDGKWKQVRMHRLIMDCPEGMEVDHRSRNKRDNREENLRVATRMQNARNRAPLSSNRTSNHKGISFHKDRKVWYARIKVGGKQKQLGTFTDEIACANAYNYYAKELHGEFAYINDVPYMSKEEWMSYKCKKEVG